MDGCNCCDEDAHGLSVVVDEVVVSMKVVVVVVGTAEEEDDKFASWTRCCVGGAATACVAESCRLVLITSLELFAVCL